jgi:hypothetical protein
MIKTLTLAAFLAGVHSAGARDRAAQHHRTPRPAQTVRRVVPDAGPLDAPEPADGAVLGRVRGLAHSLPTA